MNVYKVVLTCWICNKIHEGALYDEYLKDKKVYYCDCGGQVISNSGKVLIKHILISGNEALEQEEKRLLRLKEEIEEKIKRAEYEIEVNYRYLASIQKELFNIYNVLN